MARVTQLHRRHPRADASLYSPAPGRGLWWLSVRCPYCGGIHLCKSRDPGSAAGPRRLPCGKAEVTVRRTYRTRTDKAA